MFPLDRIKKPFATVEAMNKFFAWLIALLGWLYATRKLVAATQALLG